MSEPSLTCGTVATDQVSVLPGYGRKLRIGGTHQAAYRDVSGHLLLDFGFELGEAWVVGYLEGLIWV